MKSSRQTKKNDRLGVNVEVVDVNVPSNQRVGIISVTEQR